jgi:hypothetical protein
MFHVACMFHSTRSQIPFIRYLGSRVNRELHVPPTSTIPSLAQVTQQYRSLRLRMYFSLMIDTGTLQIAIRKLMLEMGPPNEI